MSGPWIFLGMLWLGICIDHGLTNIAKAIKYRPLSERAGHE